MLGRKCQGFVEVLGEDITHHKTASQPSLCLDSRVPQSDGTLEQEFFQFKNDFYGISTVRDNNSQVFVVTTFVFQAFSAVNIPDVQVRTW